ncbi:MAG: hypothetical protein NUW37_16590 [Planctomycetes bacterium]|nr:hypothetical protein [Planctomycetota bacterium]
MSLNVIIPGRTNSLQPGGIFTVENDNPGEDGVFNFETQAFLGDSYIATDGIGCALLSPDTGTIYPPRSAIRVKDSVRMQVVMTQDAQTISDSEVAPQVILREGANPRDPKAKVISVCPLHSFRAARTRKELQKETIHAIGFDFGTSHVGIAFCVDQDGRRNYVLGWNKQSPKMARPLEVRQLKKLRHEYRPMPTEILVLRHHIPDQPRVMIFGIDTKWQTEFHSQYYSEIKKLVDNPEYSSQTVVFTDRYKEGGKPRNLHTQNLATPCTDIPKYYFQGLISSLSRQYHLGDRLIVTASFTGAYSEEKREEFLRAIARGFRIPRSRVMDVEEAASDSLAWLAHTIFTSGLAARGGVMRENNELLQVLFPEHAEQFPVPITKEEILKCATDYEDGIPSKYKGAYVLPVTINIGGGTTDVSANLFAIEATDYKKYRQLAGDITETDAFNVQANPPIVPVYLNGHLEPFIGGTFHTWQLSELLKYRLVKSAFDEGAYEAAIGETQVPAEDHNQVIARKLMALTLLASGNRWPRECYEVRVENGVKREFLKPELLIRLLRPESVKAEDSDEKRRAARELRRRFRDYIVTAKNVLSGKYAFLSRGHPDFGEEEDSIIRELDALREGYVREAEALMKDQRGGGDLSFEEKRVAEEKGETKFRSVTMDENFLDKHELWMNFPTETLDESRETRDSDVSREDIGTQKWKKIDDLAAPIREELEAWYGKSLEDLLQHSTEDSSAAYELFHDRLFHPKNLTRYQHSNSHRHFIFRFSTLETELENINSLIRGALSTDYGRHYNQSEPASLIKKGLAQTLEFIAERVKKAYTFPYTVTVKDRSGDVRKVSMKPSDEIPLDLKISFTGDPYEKEQFECAIGLLHDGLAQVAEKHKVTHLLPKARELFDFFCTLSLSYQAVTRYSIIPLAGALNNALDMFDPNDTLDLPRPSSFRKYYDAIVNDSHWFLGMTSKPVDKSEDLVAAFLRLQKNCRDAIEELKLHQKQSPQVKNQSVSQLRDQLSNLRANYKAKRKQLQSQIEVNIDDQSEFRMLGLAIRDLERKIDILRKDLQGDEEGAEKTDIERAIDILFAYHGKLSFLWNLELEDGTLLQEQWTTHLDDQGRPSIFYDKYKQEFELVRKGFQRVEKELKEDLAIPLYSTTFDENIPREEFTKDHLYWKVIVLAGQASGFRLVVPILEGLKNYRLHGGKNQHLADIDLIDHFSIRPRKIEKLTEAQQQNLPLMRKLSGALGCLYHANFRLSGKNFISFAPMIKNHRLTVPLADGGEWPDRVLVPRGAPHHTEYHQILSTTGRIEDKLFIVWDHVKHLDRPWGVGEYISLFILQGNPDCLGIFKLATLSGKFDRATTYFASYAMREDRLYASIKYLPVLYPASDTSDQKYMRVSAAPREFQVAVQQPAWRFLKPQALGEFIDFTRDPFLTLRAGSMPLIRDIPDMQVLEHVHPVRDLKVVEELYLTRWEQIEAASEAAFVKLAKETPDAEAALAGNDDPVANEAPAPAELPAHSPFVLDREEDDDEDENDSLSEPGVGALIIDPSSMRELDDDDDDDDADLFDEEDDDDFLGETDDEDFGVLPDENEETTDDDLFDEDDDSPPPPPKGVKVKEVRDETSRHKTNLKPPPRRAILDDDDTHEDLPANWDED